MTYNKTTDKAKVEMFKEWFYKFLSPHRNMPSASHPKYYTHGKVVVKPDHLLVMITDEKTILNMDINWFDNKIYNLETCGWKTVPLSVKFIKNP